MMAELPRLRAEDRQEVLEHLWPIEEATPTRNRFLPWEDRACRAYPCAARVSGLPESAGLGRRAPKRLAILSRLAFYPHSGTPSGHHHPIEHHLFAFPVAIPIRLPVDDLCYAVRTH